MQRIQDQLDAIYTDLSTNVTRIYKRNNLHLAVDLVFHSPLSMYFGNRLLKKGHPEVLIIGDTRCGKSETMLRLLSHYRLGTCSSGENTSFAGLVGGCKTIRNRWRMSWGRIPLNHGGLLGIDEVSGMPLDDIGKMSSLRSSGIAEVTKIQTERTPAQTRLVWLSNPRDDDPVCNHGSGTAIIKKLIGKPEDIARFDFALILEKDEISHEDADERRQPVVDHVHTSDMCHELLLWVWSRTADQVRLDSATVDACHVLGKKMSEKYSSDCPIVNSREQMVKLARLATALACRLFSCDETGDKVVVTPAHVEYVYRFLNEEYDKPHFGYDQFSRQIFDLHSVDDPEEIKEMLSKWGVRISANILQTHQITVRGIEEVTGSDYNEAKMYISKFVRVGALTKRHTFYVKTPAFIKILYEFLNYPKKPKKEEF